jgi:hypothetical protein
LSDASLTGGNAERRSKGSGRQPKNAQRALKALLRANGLSLVLLMLLIVLLGGQSVSGMYEYNEERSEHGERPLGLAEYLATGHFLEATAENWESEFLQMAAYVLLTAWLFQKGSSESKKLDEKEGVDRDLRQSNREGAPGPVRHGGWRLRLYEHSLSIAFLTLFLLSFILHAVGGAEEYSAEQRAHGGRGRAVPMYSSTDTPSEESRCLSRKTMLYANSRIGYGRRGAVNTVWICRIGSTQKADRRLTGSWAVGR